jgi:hypothetical protein
VAIDSDPAERCACPERHPTPDGTCANPSIRSEESSVDDFDRLRVVDAAWRIARMSGTQSLPIAR